MRYFLLPFMIGTATLLCCNATPQSSTQPALDGRAGLRDESGACPYLRQESSGHAPEILPALGTMVRDLYKEEYSLGDLVAREDRWWSSTTGDVKISVDTSTLVLLQVANLRLMEVVAEASGSGAALEKPLWNLEDALDTAISYVEMLREGVPSDAFLSGQRGSGAIRCVPAIEWISERYDTYYSCWAVAWDRFVDGIRVLTQGNITLYFHEKYGLVHYICFWEDMERYPHKRKIGQAEAIALAKDYLQMQIAQNPSFCWVVEGALALEVTYVEEGWARRSRIFENSSQQDNEPLELPGDRYHLVWNVVFALRDSRNLSPKGSISIWLRQDTGEVIGGT